MMPFRTKPSIYFGNADKLNPMSLREWKMSLAVRLWATTTALLVICFAVISPGMRFVIARFPVQLLGFHTQFFDTRRVISSIEYDRDGRPISTHLDRVEQWVYHAAPTEIMFRVIDSKRNILLASNDHMARMPWESQMNRLDVESTVKGYIEGGKFYIISVPFDHLGRQYIAQTAISDEYAHIAFENNVTSTIRAAVIIVFVAVIVFGIILFFTIRKGLRPLRAVSAAASEISPRNLEARLSVNDIPFEIKPLISSFNDALERLDLGYKAQRDFLATVAHELNTPLTLLRSQIEVQADIKDKDLLFQEIDLMSRQVRQLLHLAEAGEPTSYKWEAIDCIDVATQVAENLNRVAVQKNIDVKVVCNTEHISVKGDRAALSVLLRNLVDNAVNASGSDSSVIVKIAPGNISVIDSGSGIREEHLPHIFERFWRPPDAQYRGAGIGLSICKAIASAHGWDLSVTSGETGTAFILAFSGVDSSSSNRNALDG